MKSMTGYGKGVFASEGREVAIEIKTVNNRFLEFSMRIPKIMQPMDELLRQLISKKIKRGTVEVYLSYTNLADPQLSVVADLNLIEEYLNLAKQVNAKIGIENDLTFLGLMRVPDLIKTQQAVQNIDLFAPIIRSAAEEAIKNLNKMREKEGKAIGVNLKELLNSFMDILQSIKERSPIIIEEYRKKLKERISEYLNQIEMDETRLINEVAFFADKADINEELQRLDSHLDQFKECLSRKEPTGRKLDFICQEIGREINTLGSKANDISLINGVVELKNILEKIKEQIRNLE